MGLFLLAMDIKLEVTSDPIFDSVEQKIWKQSLNLPDATAEELKEVLTTLKSLPFKNEKQRTSLFESVQCLQGYHIVQIFNVGVARLQKSEKESRKCVEKIITLFEICSSFCYNADASKRVSFEHYLRALKFCFPSEPKKHHLSTEIISMLLELVQILQEKKLCTYPFMNAADLAKPDFCLKGARELFDELLTILETRPYDESDVVEIIKQAMRFATADAKADHPDLTHLIMKHLPELPFQFDQAIPAVLFKNWIDLLQLTKAGDAAFVIRVAMEGHRLHQLSLAIVGMPPVCYIVDVLQSMKKNGEQVDLSHDESRLKVFFSNIKHLFENDYQTTVPLLKMLSFKPISDTILAEVYKLFLSKENEEPQHVASPVARHKAQTLESIRQLLFVLPEGSLAVKVLKFWNHVYPNNSDYTALKGLLDLFTGLKTKGSNSREDSLEERAERLLEFITNVLSPSKKPSSGHSWAAFLGLLTSIFPTSFDKLPVEVLSFIEKAVQTPPLQTEALQEYQCKTCDFLNWLSQQKCTEKDKENMVAIYMRCVDPISGRNLLSVDLIKSLCLCKPLSLNYMDSFIQEIIGFSKHFKPNENDIIRDLVSKVAASSESQVNHQEIFTELSNTMKHLWDESKPPMKSTRVETFELISLLAKGPLSSLKTVRLLQLSRKSSDGLQCCLRYLQLTSSTSAILKERAFEHFELLFVAMFETLNGNKNLCEMFYTHHRDFTASVSNCCLSVNLLNIWSFVVAGLLSLGLFKEKVDSQYCMQVLARATGFDCPFKALQLYFQLRSLFSTLISLLTIRAPKWSIEQKHSQSATPNPVANLVKALSLIVQSDVSPPDTKLLLIDKVYKLVLNNPRIMIGNVLPSALGNIIPIHHDIRHEDIVSDHLELQHIVAILDRPGMLVQLANIASTPSQSLQSVLCSRIPNPLSKDDVVEIYECVASLKDANKEFFFHLLPLLESITKVCISVSDVRDLLMEAEVLLRQIRPQLIPLSVLIFSYLVESKVSKVYREPFIKQVALEWESPCDLDMYTYYKIPQLLWKAHQSASSAEGKLEIIDHIHEVIVRSKDLETHVPKEQNSKMNGVHRSVACCDLEWLTIYNSSLTCQDVALCFHLSSCYPGVHALKCFSSVSGVQIQDGCLTPILLQQNEASKVSADKCPSRINDGGEDFVEGRATCTQTETLPSLLTPAMVARKMIDQLRRLRGDDINLRDIAVKLWNNLFTHHFLPCPDVVCKSSKWSSTCDDFVNVFLSFLEKAPYLEVINPWFSSNRSPHHVAQCSNVILESCGWNGKNAVKESHLQIQAEVIATLEILRSVSEVPFLPPLCFRPLQPQLECLLRILQKRWPLEVTANLLRLSRIDWKAASAISAIASHWSSREEVEKLVVGVLRLFNEGEIPMYLPLQKEFVWDMLEACSRVYMNSKDLLGRLDCLINFQNPEELDYGFYRLPEWRKMMTAEGFPAHVIDKWCVAFLFTPREKLSSRDIDAVLDLRPSSLQLVASVFQSIKKCIFPSDFHVTREEGIKDHQKRLRLARLLGEFVNIVKIRKSKEASNDAAVTKIVEDACEELCKSYLQNNTNKNLYKIHRHKLKDLFTKVFGKQPTFDDERVDLQECGRREAVSEVHENESRQAVSEAHENESREAVSEAHENESREAVPEAHENESREVVPEAHENESREAVPEAHENESREAVPEAHENESREAVPEAHENESREAVPEARESESRGAVPEAHENESREAVPEAHESESREVVPEAHENESREVVPEAHESESREAVSEAHENESREAVPEAHENESREVVPEAHESESREAVSEAHENESREVVPEAHENESREAEPEAHENESRGAVPEAHENESREAVPEAHENESREVVPEAHESESREAVSEAHENESREVLPEAHENESREAEPEAHENESRGAVPEAHENESREAVPEARKSESRGAVPEAHENESREVVPEAHESESREAVSEAHENESREAVSEAHENESREAVPEARESESRGAVPEAHENESREVVPEAHENESREVVPEAHESESREAVSEAHENKSREAVPEAHENESREVVPEAHESESREAVSEAHENESREVVPEAHENESREAEPEAHENESREAVPEAHENKSREAVPEAHENESREAVSEAHENESREAVSEAHENESREVVPGAHESESREAVPEAHENESREAGPEVHENESREAVPEAHENKSREAVPEVHENESRVAMPNVHEDETKEAVPEAHENESGVAVPEVQKNESRVAVPETHENESKEAVPAQRQSSHRQGNSSKVLDRVEVYEPMLVLLRRWLSSITNKPTLASLTLDVVQLLSSEHSTKKGSSLLEELHHKIQPHILHCPANQILVSQLQAVGYNQGDPAVNQDLWASPSVELSCYLSKRESPGEKTFEKKLTNVLRRHWMEWKNLLFMLNIPDINVGESKVCTKDLFGSQASLKEMEKQVAAVKERVSQVHSEDVDRRVKQLIRQEQRHRSRIKELYKSDKVSI